MPEQYAMEVETFLQYIYPQTKDLCLHFLTLVSGILVFSVTFSEKIVGFHTAGVWARRLLLAAWVLFVTSIIAGGASLTMLFLAAGRAFAGAAHWADLMVTAGYWLFFAGGVFCLGLMALAVAGTVHVLTRSINERTDIAT